MPSRIPVLVVEDEPILRFDIVDTLNDAGFHVHEAGNATEAIEILTQNTGIRLVFTDVDMPGGMDGIKLAGYIRDRWPPLKIITVGMPRTMYFIAVSGLSSTLSLPTATLPV